MLAQTQGEVGRVSDSLDPLQLTWPSVLIAIAVLVAAIIASRLARRWIRRLGDRVDFGSPGLVTSLARMSSWIIIFVGFVTALRVIGVDFIPLLAGLGIAAVVIAVSLRPFLENFAAGLTLQLRRPIDIGEQIAVGEVQGEVLDMNARAVVILTMDGTTVHVPNARVVESAVTNLTRRGRRRSTIDIRLVYGTDLEAAVPMLVEAVRTVPGVLMVPPPEAFVFELAESSINVRVRFWHDPLIRTGWTIRHEVAVAVTGALETNGIEVAFPQHVLWDGDPDESEGEAP